MPPTYLPTIHRHVPDGAAGNGIRMLEAAGLPVPGIVRLIAYRPERTGHLARFSEAVMRGPSQLSPGLRELIAAFTSLQNHCLF